MRVYLVFQIAAILLLLCLTSSCDSLPSPVLPTTNVRPIAKFDYVPITPQADLPTLFDGSRSYDVDGRIVSYAWNFGDQTSAIGVSTTKTFLSVGTFYVRLSVTDDRGESGYITRTVTVPIHAGPSLPEGLRVSDLEFRGTDPSQEYIELKAHYPTDLYGCKLTSSSGQHFVFQQHKNLESGETARVYSGTGNPSGNTFYWGASSEIWPDNGAAASLYRTVGVQGVQVLIDYWEYGQGT